MISSKKGHRLEDIKDYNNAIRHFDEAIATDPGNYNAYYGKGIALTNLGRNREAIKYFDKAIELNPDKNFYISSHKINALKTLKQYDKALKCFDDTCRSEINFSTRQNSTILNKNFRLYENVLNNYEKTKRKNLLKINYSEHYFKKGMFLLDLKNYHVAVKCFDKAIELDSDFADAYFYKAKVLKILKYPREAQICFEKARELNEIIEE